MKRILVVMAVGALLLPACAGATARRPAVAPQMRATPRIPNRVYYTKRCWPGCHYDSGTVKPAPHPEVDDFDGTLASDWAWVNEDPTHWTLTEAPGVLRVTSQSGSISGGPAGAQNVLVRGAPAGHFDIVAKVTFDPTADSQSAAIFIELDDGQVVSLSRGYRDAADECDCVGSGIYLDGPAPGCMGGGVPTSADTVLLMLRKAGTSTVGYYQLEDGDWVEVGRCTNLTTAPTSVGLTALSDSADPDVPELAADFDSLALVERD